MDSINPGAYLGSLMGAPAASAGAAPASAAPAAPIPTPAASAPGAAPKASAGAAVVPLDAQILKLAAAAGPTSEGGSSEATPAPGTAAVQTNTPQANAQAAQTAANAINSKPAYLKFGLPPLTGTWTTPLRIPHAVANTLNGMGDEGWRIGQGLYNSATGILPAPLRQKVPGRTPSPLAGAVRAQGLSGPAGHIGGFLTDMLLTAPVGGAVDAGLARAGSLGAKLAGNALTSGATQGAVEGAMLANPGERLQGAGLGGVLGAAPTLAARPLRWLARGIERSPEAQSLLDRGVQLTPGQMNPHGAVVNRVEQAATSLPVIGGAIAKARAAGIPQYTRAMIQDALAPGAKLSSAARDFEEQVREAGEGFKKFYDHLLQSHAGTSYPMRPVIMHANQPDVPLDKAFQAVAATPRLGLTAADRAGVGKQLQAQLNETLAVARRGGGLDATDLQNLRSQLRDAARDVSPTDNASRAKRGLWNDAQSVVTQALESQLPAKVSQHLRDADTQYGKFAIVRNVARATKDRPEGPTTAMWQNAIAQATPKNVYAAGGGWNRNLSKAARSVFESTVPHTGLTGAGTVAPIVEGIVAGLLAPHNPALALGTLGGLGALRAAYTRPGLRLMAGQLPIQQALQRRIGAVNPNLLEALSRYGRNALLNRPLSVALGLPSAQGAGSPPQ